MKCYKLGIDSEGSPCIEVDGKIILCMDIELALIKALIKKGLVTKAEIKAEL